LETSRASVAAALRTRAADRFELRLLGGFELRNDTEVVLLPPTAQRVVAYLAMARRPVSRSQCAGTLWALATQDQANGNLRTALWRLSRRCAHLLVREQDQLRLSPHLRVDSELRTILCLGLVSAEGTAEPTLVSDLEADVELLPGWSDPWVVLERERLRLLRIHALEAASIKLAQVSPELAMLAAMAVVATEPLQESAWRLVVDLHLRQGNLAGAQRAYTTYRTMLGAELGVEPSEHMEALLRRYRRRAAPPAAVATPASAFLATSQGST
jgi:DNA-binding SARP family transcriptional activator